MVKVIDIDDKIIELPEDSNFYYTDEDGKNYSSRVEFNEIFGSVENYVATGYESVTVSNFDMEALRKDEYLGDFVLKLVLDDATVITNFYTFIGFEDEESIKLIPVKITKENMYTIDPTRIVSFNWYYLESDKIVEYV